MEMNKDKWEQMPMNKDDGPRDNRLWGNEFSQLKLIDSKTHWKLASELSWATTSTKLWYQLNLSGLAAATLCVLEAAYLGVILFQTWRAHTWIHLGVIPT